MLVSALAFSQKSAEKFRFFGVRSYAGELRLRGFYRDQEQSGEKINEKQQSYYYSGGLFLSAGTYLLHPNFCVLDLGASYMPGSGRDNYMNAPDFSEVRTVKHLNFMSTFFSQKKFNILASASYDESYAKRENMTNIKSTSKYYGGSVIYSNKFLPFTLDFFRRKLEQVEIQTGRKLIMDQINLSGRADQSFSSWDHQQLIYSHKIVSSLNENNFYTSNTADEVDFTSKIDVGAKKIFTFNTTISNIYQRGTYNYGRFQAMEDLVVTLPANFKFHTNYNLYNIQQPFGKTLQYISTNYLTHQLFKSLSSRIYIEYTQLRNKFYAESNSKTGFDLNYTKKIPWGVLQLSYGYFRYHQNYSADSAELNIMNEEYQLTDGKIVLLRRAYVAKSSVVVKDVTGTIYYQQGLDYLLVEHGNYLEILRVPSGQIPNNGTVYIDYTVVQPRSYSYDADNHVFATNFSLLKGRLDLYYRLSLQNYKNLDHTDYISLNYFTQQVVGFRIGFDLINGGAEYENYKSTILPYHMIRVYINMQKNFKNRVTIAMNGNLQNYTMLNEPEAREQQFADVTGKVEYTIINQTRLNLDVMYRKQVGHQIDLDLVTARLEFNSVIHKLYLTAGIEFYRRNYIGERINFKGTYIQISRRF